MYVVIRHVRDRRDPLSSDRAKSKGIDKNLKKNTHSAITSLNHEILIKQFKIQIDNEAKNFQQYMTKISHKNIYDENCEKGPSNCNPGEMLFEEEEKDSAFRTSQSFLNDFDESISTSLTDCTDEQKNFVAMCIREFDKSELLPKDFDRWTVKEQYDHLISDIGKYFPNIPESLRYILPGIFEDGDCGRAANARPPWLDMDKFRRGQKFAQAYYAVVSLSQVQAMCFLFNFVDITKPLILSERSNTPYRAFKRYLSTICRVRNWYFHDPWQEGTPAYRDIQAVRRMHREMRRKLCDMDDEQIDLASRIPNALCPTLKVIVEDFARNVCPLARNSFHCPYSMMRTKGLHQADMLITQFTFMGLIVFYPEYFGAFNDEDLEAFCHLWRGLGYLLGIEDKYNFCRGDLHDVRRRGEDFIEYCVKPNFLKVTPEWEHMSICLYEGLDYLFPTLVYKITFLWICDMLRLDMPGFYRSLSLWEKFQYKLSKFTSNVFRIPGLYTIANKMLHKYLDQALDFGPEKHFELQKKSNAYYSPALQR